MSDDLTLHGLSPAQMVTEVTARIDAACAILSGDRRAHRPPDEAAILLLQRANDWARRLAE